jgi:3-oxoacyl-[acyl-carrier protein] reductase
VGLRDFSVEGLTVVVTGSSQGIGRAVAVGMAREGAKVVVNSRHREKLQPVVEEIENSRGEVLAVQADMRNPDDVNRLMEEARKRFGRIDVLINNAGGSFGHRLDELSPNGFEAVVRNNLNQVFYACRAVRPIMAEQGGGKIINISSVAGLRGSPGLGAYGAAKAGVIQLTQTLAVEWAVYGITVNCIAPGLILTEGAEEVLVPNEEKRREYERKIPAGRLGVPEDILNACIYLSSPASSYVNGHTLVVDGGPRLA